MRELEGDLRGRRKSVLAVENHRLRAVEPQLITVAHIDRYEDEDSIETGALRRSRITIAELPADAGLIEVCNRPDPFTVFAPTDG